MALDLVDFDEIAAYLGLTKSEDKYQAIEVIEPQVAAAIEDYIGRELEKKERTAELFTQFPETMLKLKALPISAVTSITYQPIGQDAVSLDATEFMASSFGIQTVTLIPEDSKVTIVYTGGYKNNEMPASIKRAAFLQTIYEFQTKDYLGSERIQTEGGTVTRKGLVLLPEVRRLLDNQKHPLMLV